MADIGAANAYNSTTALAAVMFAAQGYIVIASNYAGYDTSNLSYHPEHIAQQNGQEMIDALAAARQATETNDLRWAAMARALGIIYFAILPSDHTEECRQRVANATSSIQDACAKLAGHATVPWCPAEWKSTLQIWGPQRQDFPQMQKAKAVFDPQNVLSSGRFSENL